MIGNVYLLDTGDTLRIEEFRTMPQGTVYFGTISGEGPYTSVGHWTFNMQETILTHSTTMSQTIMELNIKENPEYFL